MANQSNMDWEYLPLIDFGIKLLNTIPSKHLNLAHLPTEEVQNLRITYEEWNLSISPLQIVRGLAVLYILADGKCKIKLSNLISKALFGTIEPLGKNIHEILNDLCIYYLKSNGAIQIYFEENHLLTFDDELIEYIEKYYGTKSRGMEMTSFDLEEKSRKAVVQTMCFQANSNGQTLVNEMNKNIKEATCGSITYVIRQDLSPKQQTRLALVSSFDSTFYWRPRGQITEVIIPCFSINSPVGLRSAEFGMIYGKAAQDYYGPSHIYPLWDYYHKTKMALKIGQPELKDEIDSELPAITYERPTMKDESIEHKQQQQIFAITGRMMIIEGQIETNRKHYMIGILGNENDDNFICKQMLDSLAKPKDERQINEKV
ncbi:hypothetical protein DINM_000104 [Dirofilaria immitis]|nr:hypothetical protein [Dirofilaria immitis]